MDATDIKYDNECFDYIIDKATLDCVLASDDSVDKALDALHVLILNTCRTITHALFN